MGPGEAITALLLAGCVLAREGSEQAVRKAEPAPHSVEPSITRPSELDKPRLEAKAPSLAATGPEAVRAARAFIDWAGAATIRQREEVGRLVSDARGSREVATTFCDEAFRAA